MSSEAVAAGRRDLDSDRAATPRRWARKPTLAVVDGADRAVVLDLDRPDEQPLVLEGTGQAVWDAFRVPHALDDVVTALAERYGEAPEEVGPDVRAFVAGLITRGLLVPA